MSQAAALSPAACSNSSSCMTAQRKPVPYLLEGRYRVERDLGLVGETCVLVQNFFEELRQVVPECR